MSDVDRLLKDYIAEHKAGGEADPLAFLDQLEADGDRAELIALIDAYLAQAPRHEFDAEAFRSSPAAAIVDDLSRSLHGVSGLWPSLLPALRSRAKLKRSEIVERLAESLGQAGREEKVGRYYHQMETGDLPSTGVSQRVLEALGAIVGESADALRRAGRAVGGAADASAPGAVFARTARTQPQAMTSAPAAGPADPGTGDEWDEVDDLFRDG